MRNAITFLHDRFIVTIVSLAQTRSLQYRVYLEMSLVFVNHANFDSKHWIYVDHSLYEEKEMKKLMSYDLTLT